MVCRLSSANGSYSRGAAKLAEKIKKLPEINYQPENGIYSRNAATNAKKIKTLFKMWLHLSGDWSNLHKSLFLNVVSLRRCVQLLF